MVPVLMARLALRSQLPRRLLLENRAWPERLRLLVLEGLAVPCCKPSVTPPKSDLPLLTLPRALCRCSEPRPRSAASKKQSGTILTPPCRGLIRVSGCCCLHCHCCGPVPGR